MARRAREKLGLKRVAARPVALFAKIITGGKAKVMELAKLAASIEPRLAYVLEAYEGLGPTLRPSVSVDEICAKNQVDPLHFVDAVAEAALRFRNMHTISIAAQMVGHVFAGSEAPSNSKGKDLTNFWDGADLEPIAFFVKLLPGGKREFMRFVRLAAQLEPRLAALVEEYESLTPSYRYLVSIDELSVRYEIDPYHLIGLAGAGEMKYENGCSIMMIAIEMPAIVEQLHRGSQENRRLR